MAINCANNPAGAGTLCVMPSATATPSITPSASSTASATPTATLSVGAVPSVSAAGTPSGSATAAVTPSVSPSTTPSPTLLAVPRWMQPVAARTLQFAVGTTTYTTYTLRPFRSISQTMPDEVTVNSLGTFAGWNALVPDGNCSSGLRYDAQLFTGGTQCGAVARTSTLRFTCSATGIPFLIAPNVSPESPTCVYTFNYAIDCTGNFGKMCLEATPTPTPSSTASVTGTPSPSSTGSPSPSVTASITASQTASLTAGVTSSVSPSSSVSRSLSSSPSATATATPPPTSSPMSEHPYAVRVTARGVALGLYEVLAFGVGGKLLTATAAGAAASSSSSTAGRPAANGADLCVNPYFSVCPMAETESGADVFYQAVFPGDVYGAEPVATVYVVNNPVSPILFTSGQGAVELVRPNGTLVASGALTSAIVNTLNFAASAAPVAPPAGGWQLTEDALFGAARYVRVTGSGTTALHFRELMVLDDTLTNVALGKAATSSAQRVADGETAYTAGMAVNGVIDWENQVSGDMTYSATAAGAWWEVDLGGAYK